MNAKTRSALLVAALATAVTAPAQAATAPTFLAMVGPSDGGVGMPLAAFDATFGYFDANRNGRFDLADPDEPMYFDLDASQSVTYGDVRLTPFHHYAAGSAVDLTNADRGVVLTQPRGWLASTATDEWFLDANGDGRVNVADVRLSEPGFGTKVAGDDPRIGSRLDAAQQDVIVTERVGAIDPNGNGVRDLLEPVYFDLDWGPPQAAQVSVGDLRMGAVAVGLDDEPTRREFTTAQDEAAADRETARNNEGWLLALGLLDLAGVAALAWVVWGMKRRTAPPQRAVPPGATPR